MIRFLVQKSVHGLNQDFQDFRIYGIFLVFFAKKLLLSDIIHHQSHIKKNTLARPTKHKKILLIL